MMNRYDRLLLRPPDCSAIGHLSHCLRRKVTAEKRKGRQTPTQGFVLPYTKTFGQEAVDLYNTTGRTAQEWQELLIYDMLAVDDEGLYVHSRFGSPFHGETAKTRLL